MKGLQSVDGAVMEASGVGHSPLVALAEPLPRPTWRARLMACVVSSALSLGVAELAAAASHHHAYAFLNVFEADARFGVRLAAGAHTRTRSRLGRVTDVAINAQGFRGPDWSPAPSDRTLPRRALLLGDSQVFGYGVAWETSLAPQLARALGGDAEAYAAAVPTWGPTEYVRALEDLAPAYRPGLVIFVANAANDWFETSVDNTRRTVARDGWAERLTLPRTTPRWFPGRSFVMGRSHLMLAARELFAHAVEAGPPPAEMATRLLSELPRLGRPHGRLRSRMTPHLLAADALCQRLGCRVVAVALPLDVQVHPGEWAKYHSPPQDLRATERLLTDFIADAGDAGLLAVDLLGPLRAASPGAFLPDDYHLSPAGHRAAARAIAAALNHPTPEAPR
jgi:hypothetical protein